MMLDVASVHKSSVSELPGQTTVDQGGWQPCTVKSLGRFGMHRVNRLWSYRLHLCNDDADQQCMHPKFANITLCGIMQISCKQASCRCNISSQHDGAH